jgi:glucose/arabinose dehydrogenase
MPISWRIARTLAYTLVPLALGGCGHAAAQNGGCDPENGGLTLPAGYCAAVVGKDLGSVRQLTVAPNGDLYAAVSGNHAPGGGGVLAFRDRDRDGSLEERAAFGPEGGNDVRVRDGAIYLAMPNRILRFRLAAGQLAPDGEGEVVVRDLPTGGDHPNKSLAFGGGDTMFVSVGSATNSCQAKNRAARSPGEDPCRELERRAGVWTFSATRLGQRMADGARFATGLRNALALAVDPRTGQLWAAVHGRDQLGDNWGFPDSVNANEPAEELAPLRAGDDFGWPYCYYSNQIGKKVLAPEYGGDGRTVGRCTSAKDPAFAFPGHWAPLALAFADSGVYVAFHGSWNRAPLPQAGYRVVFMPFAGGRPAGPYTTFAIGTAGPTWLRASGVAVAPDGSVYVSSDRVGMIWRIMKAPAGPVPARAP